MCNGRSLWDLLRDRSYLRAGLLRVEYIEEDHKRIEAAFDTTWLKQFNLWASDNDHVERIDVNVHKIRHKGGRGLVEGIFPPFTNFTLLNY